MRSYFENALPYLKCFYQPIYNVEKKKINAAEALLRYDDGHHQNIEQVIREAEEQGCVCCFDLWVLEQVLRQLPELKKRGIERVNVNLSPVTCSSAEIEKKIFSMLDECTADVSGICFELTESNHIQNMEQVIKLSEDLIKRGFFVAIDDFGKEESNLPRIMKIPFSVLKIDKEVIWSMDATEFSRDILLAIIRFLHSYGIQTTAEGIETLEQAKEVAAMGCDFLQGYLLAKPLPFDEFCSFVDMRNKKEAHWMEETRKKAPKKEKMKKGKIPYDLTVSAD